MARQKNKELRQKILKSAYTRFMQDDYDNIYLKDIAADCEISTSLLHHYFPTKADIIVNIIYDMLMKSNRFLAKKPACVANEITGTAAYYELASRLFVDVLTRNNNQILRFYSYVLCDARLMNRVIDFTFAHLVPYPELKDSFEKRYELYLHYGSLAHVALLYLDDRLPSSMYEALTALFRRWYYGLGYDAGQIERIQKKLDEIATVEFRDEFYAEYIQSLDEFVSCEW